MNLGRLLMFGCFLAVLGGQHLATAQTDTPLANRKTEELESILLASRNDTTKISLLNTLAERYIRETPLKARRYAQEALDLSRNLKASKGIQRSADNLGSILQSQGFHAQALNYYEQALKLKETINDRAGIAESYQRIGTAHVLQEEFDLGISFLERSLSLRQTLKDAKGISTTLTGLATVYYRKAAYDDAINLHREALAIADSLVDRALIAANLKGLGKSYFRLNNFKEASRCYQQLEHLGRRTSNKEELQNAYEGLATVAAAEGDYKKAFEYSQEYAKNREAYLNALRSQEQQDQEETERILLIERQQRQIAEADNDRQNLILYFVVGGLVFVVIVAIIFFRSFRQQQAANVILERQKEEIERSHQELEERQNQLEEQKRQIEIQSESIHRKNESIEDAFKEIERKNKDITASINYAKRIQESMLPRSTDIAAALPEHFILFRPRDIVSGDFYWFTQKGDKIFLALLDCTGHGVPGAIMSMLGDSYLNQIIKLQNITAPDAILTALHESIGVALNQEITKNQDGMDVAMCVIDYTQNTMEFAGASRPMLIIQEGESQNIESSKLPVGGFQKDRERVFTVHRFDLNIPTTFYVYSDGYQDQFGGSRGRKFAKNRLDELIISIHQQPMNEQRRLLNTTLIDWMGQNRQMDDILIIGVRWHKPNMQA